MQLEASQGQQDAQTAGSFKRVSPQQVGKGFFFSLAHIFRTNGESGEVGGHRNAGGKVGKKVVSDKMVSLNKITD